MGLSVLIDIATKHSLEGLGLEAPLDYESALSIQGPACSQLSQQEQLHMLWLSVHGLAELHVVGENCLLGTLTCHLHCMNAVTCQTCNALLFAVQSHHPQDGHWNAIKLRMVDAKSCTSGWRCKQDMCLSCGTYIPVAAS